jgi:hypothetical protein
MFSELDGPVIADQEISAVSKFLDDRGLVGVINSSGQTGAGRNGWTRINFLKYKLSDKVLYVNSL